MTAISASHVLNDAVSQLDRMLSAPAPEKVEVDGRSLAQLIAFAASYGELICFFDLENKPDGDWAEFFAADPAVGHALHAALDLPEIERAVHSMLKTAKDAVEYSERRILLRRLFDAIARLLAILDRDLQKRGASETWLRGYRLRHKEEMLQNRLERLQRHMAHHSVDDGLQLDFAGWGSALIDALEDLSVELIAVLAQDKDTAVRLLQASLQSGDHAPQAAVYNAFVQLFVQQRETLNRFPKRLVDFYYGGVLDQHGLVARPDRVFLAFTRAKDALQASVPRGALFSAGTDSDGAAINYAAETALEVTRSQVDGLSVHRVLYQPDGPDADTMLPTGVLSGIVALDKGGGDSLKPFPLFGMDKAGSYGSLTMQQAVLGFCVSSPTLMLTGGQRKIEIALILSRKCPLLSVLKERNGAGAPSDSAISRFMADVIESNFHLYYSTAGGWMDVESFSVTPVPFSDDSEAVLFAIEFELPADAPPLVSLSTQPAKGASPPTHPPDMFPETPEDPAVVGGLNLSSRAQPVAFALLSCIEIDAVSVEVNVSGLGNLTLTTPNGRADPSLHFAPLGVPPVQYSALVIYAQELFVKSIERISVSIDWVGLPVTSTGFQGYYKDYVLDADGKVSPTPLFDNTSFQIAFSLTNPGAWDVASTPQPLFRTENESTTPRSGATQANPAPDLPVLRKSVLEAPGVLPITEPPYYNPKASTLNMALAGPDYAFGNALYSSNLMAATTAQTAAAKAAARSQNGAAASGAMGQVADLNVTNETAPDRSYKTSVEAAAARAISALDGEAYTIIQNAVAQSKASPETQEQWLSDLEAAISPDSGMLRSALYKLTGHGASFSEAQTVNDALVNWIAANGEALGSGAAFTLHRARAVLAGASGIGEGWTTASGQSVATARITMSAAVQQAQPAIQPQGLPNLPWLPMTSSLSVSYTASASLVLEGIQDTPHASGASEPPSAIYGGAVPVKLSFWHIGPFSSLVPERGNVKLLPFVDTQSALYIRLSEQVSQISLLFVLVAGPNGWWDDPPEMLWEQRVGDQWARLQVLGDSTHGLRNSGIIHLSLQTGAGDAKPELRVRACGATDNAPYVKSVIANAVQARWAGPGGAEGLGTPLPAGTIKKPVDNIAGIGSTCQPMQSVGGRPPAIGRPFHKWMAERLRHKGFGIDAWDYARIALEAVPSLWQVAVVPAIDEKTGHSAPGSVWLIAVAGPDTPNIVDVTTPSADLATLAAVGQTLEAVISPFIKLTVTNPPYLRLKVTAEISFCTENTAAFWIEQLHGELIKWLSPWPDPALGVRSKQYYTRRDVAEFIRKRPYVLGIEHLDLLPEGTPHSSGFFYFTSALRHDLTAAPAKGTSGLPTAIPANAAG